MVASPTMDPAERPFEADSEGPPTEPVGGSPHPDVPAYLRGWRRYQVTTLLGEGGMGEVYRAWDPELHRWVALKFLHFADPNRLERFRREAQSQARVDHPGVCRVYEVGEVDGHPYIAMQEIQGTTLHRAARDLPLEERIRLVAQVADAVHAAHRIGLIHRDLKPSNVLVTEGEEGLHPYVVDFGLARDQQVEGLTVSASLSGTPGYIAPEQARGEETIDRRADVYSLGAVLYQLIAGRVPLPADNFADAILKLLQDEPEPLRQLVPSLPADLETVVMKCLEKDPARRYDSARALASDLRRWLDGEPVEAQRAGWLYRLRKKVTRYPRVAAASAAAILVIGVLAGAALRTRWEAAARAAAARRFGTAAKEMESLLRVGELAPAHDTRAERRAVRAAMERIAAESASLGPDARGAGLYALGRGALALGEADEALARLQEAWRAGERGPEVSSALGQALGRRYLDGLQRLSPDRQGAADTPLRRELERRFRDPARVYLRKAAAASMSPTSSLDAPQLVEAWLALYEGRYAAAREAAERALAGRPWLYEARQAQGLAWRREGEEASERGELDAALAALERARVPNAAAMAIARSGARVHAEECARELAVLRVSRLRRPLVEDEVTAAVVACDRAIALDPELAIAHGDKARVLLAFAEEQLRGGVDPRATVGRSVAALERQVALDPRAGDAWGNLGSAHLTLARWKVLHGDPRPELQRSIAAYQRALALDPHRATLDNGLGNAYLTLARYLDGRGLPSEQPRARAIAAYERAVAAWGGLPSAYGNLGQVWVDAGNRELTAGIDPRNSLRRAIDAFNGGLAVNRSNPPYLNNLGLAHLTLAEYQLAAGEDPRPALAEAAAKFHASLAMRPQYAIPQLNLAYTHRLEALWLLRRGEDPGAALLAGAEAIAEARRLAPADTDNLLEAARQDLVAARWQARQGRDPRPLLERAGDVAAAAIALNAESAELHHAAAERWRWLAAWQLERGEDPSSAVDRGLAEAARALVLHPGMAEALATRAALLRLRGDELGAALALLAAREANPLVSVD